MKATENRVGNWVMGNAPYQLDLNAMSLNASYLKMGKEPYYTPIPLTEEWLFKFGYIKFIENSTYSSLSLVDEHVLKYTILVEHENNSFTFPNTYKPIKLKHVHQLQNLYHALTGQELTIK